MRGRRGQHALAAAGLASLIAAAALLAMPGDQDMDTDVDVDDLAIILAARNTPASGPTDPRDLDADGFITVLDARIAATLCTRPLCEAANNPPSITGPADQMLLEDTSSAPLPVTVGDPDVGFDPNLLVLSATSSDTTLLPVANITFGGTGTARTVTVTPAADQFGTATVTLTVSDGTDTASDDFQVTVTSVNDAPSFTVGPNQLILEDAGAQTVPAWATAISPGPADESGQVLTFSVTGNTDPALFSVAPAVDATTGDLTYTPAADAFGTATITVELMDDGGTANGGVDTSGPQNFDIMISGINDVPAFVVGPDQTVLEDAGVQTVNGWASGVTAGAAEPGQVLTFNVTGNTNAALFSAGPSISSAGDLSYTPAADANGSATITIELMDDGGTANGGVDTSPSQSFDITVTTVNDAPSFTAGADQTVLEDAGAQTVNGWATAISPGPADESAQTVTFNVTGNTDPGLFSAGPAVDSAGNLTYTPAADANGSATITIEAMDDGGTADGGADTSASQTFDITMTEINDVPSFTAGPNQTVLEDAGAQTVAAWATGASAGPANESGQTLTFNVTNNSNPALFSVPPAIDSTGQLTYTPAADANGSATITFELMDDGGTADGGVDTSPSQMFDITVTAVNDAPSFTVGTNQMVLETDPAQTVPGWATGISPGPADEAGQSLTFNVTGNTNPSFFSAGPAVSSSGVLTFTPTNSTGGTATITLEVMDNGGTANGGVDTSAPQMFTITVQNVNDPPMITTDPISYTTVGNVELKVGAGAMTSAVAYVEDLMNIQAKAAVVDLDGPMALAYSLNMAPSNGTVTVGATGNFLYQPDVGFVGNDSFTYNVTDSDDTVSGTVNVTVTDANGAVGGNQVVWFVQNDAAAGGQGGANDPFDTLTEAETAGATGDTLFVLSGDGTTTGQDAGIVLVAGQRLLGHRSTSFLANGITVQTPAPPVDRPAISNTGSAVVTVADADGVEVRGLEIAGDQVGVDVDATTGAQAVILADNAVTGSTAGHGVDVASSGTADLEVVFDGNVVSSGDTDGSGTAFFGASFTGAGFTPALGTLAVSSLSNNSVANLTAAVETGVVFTRTNFDADPLTPAVDLVSAGTLVVGDNGVSRAMGPGLVLSDVRGALEIDTLTVFSQDGTGLLLDNATATAADFALTVAAGTVDVLNGPALDLDPATVDVTLASVTTAGTFPGSAVRLVDLQGAGVNISGGSLAGAQGPTFLVGDGTMNSGGNLLINYGGSITNTSGLAVDVNNRSAMSLADVTFTGAITSNSGGAGISVADNGAAAVNFQGTVTLNTGAANAVALTDNGGSTVNFTGGGLDIDVSTGTGLLATGGGTLNVTGAGNTITLTAAGRAVFMNGIALGASDVIFASIMSTGAGGNAPTVDVLSFSGVNDIGTFEGGTVSIADTAAGADGIEIGAGSGNYDFTSATVTNAAGAGINIGAATGDITFDTIDINAPATSGVAINGYAGLASDNFTISGGTIDDPGGNGVTISGATSQVNVGSVTIDDTGAAGVAISNSSGTINVTNTTIGVTGGTGTTAGNALDVVGGAGTVTVSGSILNTANRSVEVTNRTGGFVNIGSFIDDDGLGVRLDSNGAGTVNFSGGMALDTGANTAFTVTGGGTVNVTGINTIGAGAALTTTAVEVTNSTIGTSGMTFRSISVNGGSNPAIDLDNSGAGAFSVTGIDGPCGNTMAALDCDGGTLQSITGDAVLLRNTAGPVSLANMLIQNIGNTGSPAPDHHGVDGRTVSGGLTLDRVRMLRMTDSAIHGEAAGGGSTVWNGLTVTNSKFEESNRFHVAGVADGGATDEATITVEGISGTVAINSNDFDDGPGFVNLFTANSGALDVTVQNNTFDDGRKDLNGVPSVGSTAVRVNTRGTIDADIRVLNNTMIDPGSDASIVVGGFNAADNANVDLHIANNMITVNDHLSPPGLGAIFDFPNGGIGVESRGSGTFEAIIEGNTLTETQNSGGLSTGSIRVDVSAPSTEVIVRNNSLVRSWDGPLFIRADDTDGNGAQGFIQVTGNIYTGGNIGSAGDDLGTLGFVPSPSPFLPNRYQVRNGAVLDLTIDDDDMVLHDTASNASPGSHDLLINGDSAPGGSVSVLNVLVRNSAGPYATRGFRLRNDDSGVDGTDSELNLSSGGSGAGAATDINSAQAQTVLNGNGNTGTADVQFSGTNIVGTTPTLPVVTPP